MVTNQSSDRPISSLLGRRWNLGIAQRFFGEVEQAVEPQRSLGGALSISRRSPVNFRSKLGEIGELLRAASRQWPSDDPPIPKRSPTGHRIILRKLPGSRPVIGAQWAREEPKCAKTHVWGFLFYKSRENVGISRDFRLNCITNMFSDV